MNNWILGLIPGILVLISGMFILSLFLVKIVWAWTMPDLFPGAVEQGLIVKSISWFTSFKLAIFISVLAGIGGGVNKRNG
ncbi:MAG: hypothetical protein WC614_11110 [bacterium]